MMQADRTRRLLEPDRDEPWDVWAAYPELVAGEDEFLVLVAPVAAQAAVGEASDEGTPHGRPTGYRARQHASSRPLAETH